MPMSMTEIEQTLKALRLPGMRRTLEARALEAVQGRLPFLDVFSMLLKDEMDRRQSALSERRFALSGLKENKTLTDFDWQFNPKIPRRACLELLALKFIESREDVPGILRLSFRAQDDLDRAVTLLGVLGFEAKH